MEINKGPVKIEDAVFVNELRTMDGVRENILALFSERVSNNIDRINSLGDNGHMLVAEIEENGQYIDEYTMGKHGYSFLIEF